MMIVSLMYVCMYNTKGLYKPISTYSTSMMRKKNNKHIHKHSMTMKVRITHVS